MPDSPVVIREALAFRSEAYPLVLERLSPFIGDVARVLGDAMASGEIRADRSAMQRAVMFSGLLAIAHAQHWGSGGMWPALDEVPAPVVSAFLDGQSREAGMSSFVWMKVLESAPQRYDHGIGTVMDGGAACGLRGWA